MAPKTSECFCAHPKNPMNKLKGFFDFNNVMVSSNGREKRCTFRHHLAESLSADKALCVYLFARSYDNYTILYRHYGEIAERVNELWQDHKLDGRVVRSLVDHCYKINLGMFDFLSRGLERGLERLKGE